ncbi:MAG: response regulator transcription factor [Acidobacteriota bacterium]
MNILLIEDDVDVATNVAEYLEQRGVQLDFAYDGLQGLGLATKGRYSAIILDLGLPGLDGIDVCRKLRRQATSTPVLMLTARDELEEKLEGFQAGADDYVVKPFALPELYHRLVALVRRSEGAAETRLAVGDLEIDPQTREVRRGGQKIHLNRTELRLLEILARAAPKLVSREQLEAEVWGDDPVGPDLLRSYIYRIRQRIDKPFAIALLQTVHGEGYRLVEGLH